MFESGYSDGNMPHLSCTDHPFFEAKTRSLTAKNLNQTGICGNPLLQQCGMII